MSKNTLTLLFAIFSISLFACNKEVKPIETKPNAQAKDTTFNMNLPLDSNIQKFSYSIGLVTMFQNLESGIKLDMQAYLNGMNDVLNRKESKLSVQDREAVMKIIGDASIKFQKDKMEKAQMTYKTMSEKLASIQAGFLEKNKSKKGVTTTASGLQYEILKEGSGANIAFDDLFQAKMKLSYVDGTQIYNTEEGAADATITGSNLFQGWAEASSKMKIGGTYKFYFPSELAYGSTGRQGQIPPNTILVMEVTPVKNQGKFDPSKFQAPPPAEGGQR